MFFIGWVEEIFHLIIYLIIVLAFELVYSTVKGGSTKTGCVVDMKISNHYLIFSFLFFLIPFIIVPGGEQNLPLFL